MSNTIDNSCSDNGNSINECYVFENSKYNSFNFISNLDTDIQDKYKVCLGVMNYKTDCNLSADYKLLNSNFQTCENHITKDQCNSLSQIIYGNPSTEVSNGDLYGCTVNIENNIIKWSDRSYVADDNMYNKDNKNVYYIDGSIDETIVFPNYYNRQICLVNKIDKCNIYSTSKLLCEEKGCSFNLTNKCVTKSDDPEEIKKDKIKYNKNFYKSDLKSYTDQTKSLQKDINK